MKNILVTGVRAPSGLEIIRRLADAGYNVYASDSLRFPLGRFSKNVKTYTQLPSPRHDFNHFKTELIGLVKAYEIDFV